MKKSNDISGMNYIANTRNSHYFCTLVGLSLLSNDIFGMNNELQCEYEKRSLYLYARRTVFSQALTISDLRLICRTIRVNVRTRCPYFPTCHIYYFPPLTCHVHSHHWY